ncbi:putative nucleotidyltransferase [Thermacetogenium phaeum DSM 12270]|uniref:Putative nucleotidyltransferase n=2 Tax=Thermacetogenium phaeum TaxID=85874 RepID=K4LG14_THEPS|nr:putative nucleotidyltransferase [Thermacetogenium phaeum DSM 12270]KUK35862.1 MAG: Putative nucleotidyltransferase [Thermacetogenium phaeum]MDK2881612.1 uncharacterized protein [Clostridia bacterium]MDN5376567.1 uncharacterized protein [Thermacetogenium sp.]
MNELDNLIAKLKNSKALLHEQYGVEILGIFGSYVRGEQKRNSDVDILVDFKEPIGLLKFVALKNQLSEIIGRDVDLVTKTALKPGIGKRILEEVIYV